MKLSLQVEEIREYIDAERKRGIVCAIKTVDGKPVRLVFKNLGFGGCRYEVRHGAEVRTWHDLGDACADFDERG